MKPPMVGPRIGPMNGAVAKMDIATPRWAGGKRSAMTPPELVRGEEPKVPDRNLKTKSDGNGLLASPLMNLYLYKSYS
jgi:hypothetical protein